MAPFPGYLADCPDDITDAEIHHIEAMAVDLDYAVMARPDDAPDFDYYTALGRTCKRHGYNHRRPRWHEEFEREEAERAAAKLAAATA